MKYLFYLIFIPAFFLSKEGNGQWYDDFSDANLNQDPSWNGDTSDFVIEEERLRLNADQEGQTAIYTEITSDGTASFEWSFELELDFSPSTNNKATLVLFSEDSLFWTSTNAFSSPVYLLNFGESGSSDAVELHRIDSVNADPIIICRGEEGLIASAFRRNYTVNYDSGEWIISSGDHYSPYMYSETTGIDTIQVPIEGYIGMQLDYTSSHSEDIYFDNIYCGNTVIDSLTPLIENIEVVNANELYLTFSESVDSTALILSNYSLEESFANPISVDFLDSYQKGVRLVFSIEFPPWSILTLQIDNLTDIEGNMIDQLYVDFVYSPKYEAQTGEIRFNEVMSDPTPPVGLPGVEFMELINTSDSIIDLDSYSILNSGIPMYFPSFNLPPHSYVIVCKEENVGLFSPYGDVIAMDNWISLLNTGDSLILLNKSGTVLDQLNYSDSWFDDPLKKEGGWSLELIDASVSCKSRINWKESNNFYGGTPGVQNSVVEIAIENEINFFQAYLIDSTELRIEISGEMDTSILSTIMYSTSPPFQIDWDNSGIDESGMVLSCFPSFKSTITYHLSLNNLSDCRGIEIPAQEMIFGFPKLAVAGDIVINEILFNPYTGANDFIEIYNRSSEFVDLKNFRIIELYEGIPTEDARISNHSLLIAPREVLALSRNIEELPILYSQSNRSQLFEVGDLPNFSNEGGEVMIVNDDFVVIDSLKFSEEMHFSLLDDLNGISLERIHPDRPSIDKSTWVSTSESAGFATPGFMNSQYSTSILSLAQLSLEPQLFTPDNDGEKDALNIHYNLNEGGWMVNIDIYSDKGRLVRKLVENRWSESKGVIRWDGLNDNNEEINVGIYIVYFEAFNNKGEKTRAKKVCVIGKATL